MFRKKFLSMTREELRAGNISRPDIILVSGDAYIDSACSGVAVIGRVLESAGYSVAVISQPDCSSSQDIASLGEPRLFWGVSAGCVDSEVANYTALGKPRRTCDFTPGGLNRSRPDRACIVYTNLIRRYFKNTVPVVLGGIEASLRRIAHYDQRTDRIRRSILPDSKADILVYGMGEHSVLKIADRLRNNQGLEDIRGTCIMSGFAPDEYERLPDFAEAADDTRAFASMFAAFYRNSMGPAGKGMVQKYDSRFLIHHPPAPLPGRTELDRIFELPFVNDAHPLCSLKGQIKALETIRNSLVTHRGCYGECSFCAIAVHQGRSVVSRSMDSIVREARRLTNGSDFDGVIRDVGGPTANMYGSGCRRLAAGDPCTDKHCIGFNGICPELGPGHKKQMRLLGSLMALPGVKRVNISSGIRHDLILEDKMHGPDYLQQVILHHVPGQMKIAPEHCSDHVLKLMNKPDSSRTAKFAELYRSYASSSGRRTYLSCYVIAAHPGCTLRDMQAFTDFARMNLKFLPRQVQIFTPTPSTRSTVMYHSGVDPFSRIKVKSEKSQAGKKRQKDVVIQGSGSKSSTRKGKAKSRTAAWEKKRN